MKVYSDSTVSKEYVDSAAMSALTSSTTAISEVDARQTRQIKQLRNIVALSFVANLIITLSLKYLM